MHFSILLRLMRIDRDGLRRALRDHARRRSLDTRRDDVIIATPSWRHCTYTGAHATLRGKRPDQSSISAGRSRVETSLHPRFPTPSSILHVAFPADWYLQAGGKGGRGNQPRWAHARSEAVGLVSASEKGKKEKETRKMYRMNGGDAECGDV